MKALFRAGLIAGILTIASIAPLSSAKADFVHYDREVVRSAQMRLGQLGYNVAYTGVGDSVTANALMNFQRDNGLPVSGLLTEGTYNTLFGARNYAIAYNTGVTAVAPLAYSIGYTSYRQVAPAYYPSYSYYPTAAAAVPVAGYTTYAAPIAYYRYSTR